MSDAPLIRLALNPRARTLTCTSDCASSFGIKTAKEAIAFHRSISGFQPTLLHKLNDRARDLGIAQLIVKDESSRLGLNSFKPLGASLAIASLLAQKTGAPLSWRDLRAPTFCVQIQGLTLVTATTGNHGLAVAWCAQQLGCQALIFVPTDTAVTQIDAIRLHGADVIVIDGNYDQAVLIAANEARQPNHLLIQDTSWRGYEEIPRLIMQGYLTLIAEVIEQLEATTPSHVFIQIGVGSLAAAIVAHLCATLGKRRPMTVVVEPYEIGTFYESIVRGQQEPVSDDQTLTSPDDSSRFAVPSLLAWEILRDHADAFINCSIDLARSGQQRYANPIGNDMHIESGTMGAVNLGVLESLMLRPEAGALREQLRLDGGSRVLLISTEG